MALLEIEVRKLDPQNVADVTLRALAEFTAEAYELSGWSRCLLGENRDIELATRFSLANLKDGLRGGEVYIAIENDGPDAGQVLGSAIWFPPGKDEEDLKGIKSFERDEIRAKIGTEHEEWKRQAVYPAHAQAVNTSYKNASGRRSVLYLESIATRPSAQRRGVARKLLQSMIDLADQNAWKIALETGSGAHVVAFYQSLGCEVCGEGCFVSPWGEEICITAMRRPA